MYPVFGMLGISHDISAYANAALQVRFTFSTNGSVNTTTVPNAFQLVDVTIDVQATDYSASYEIMDGTSMASPMVAGIGALVKSRFPTYTAADLKQVIANTGDPISGLATLVSSGSRANAYKAVAGPAIISISPSGTMPGTGAFTLTVNGFNFESGAVVQWNGAARTTTFVSNKQLTAAIPASDVASAGLVTVTVNNPVVGIVSAGQTFSIGLLPTVITSSITGITFATATGGGNVTSDGGAPITARGVCWSTSANPTVADSHTIDGTGTGIFTSSITGLASNTIYHVRAYATNSTGTVYGSDLPFTSVERPAAPTGLTVQ